MRIPANAAQQSAMWENGSSWISPLGVWTEKQRGHGEDAEPLFLHHWSSGSGLLGVFDGLGGSGGRLVGQTRDGKERTSAWIASRCARAASEEWFQHSIEHGVQRNPESYQESLIGGLRRVGPPAQQGQQQAAPRTAHNCRRTGLPGGRGPGELAVSVGW